MKTTTKHAISDVLAAIAPIFDAARRKLGDDEDYRDVPNEVAGYLRDTADNPLPPLESQPNKRS